MKLQLRQYFELPPASPASMIASKLAFILDMNSHNIKQKWKNNLHYENVRFWN